MSGTQITFVACALVITAALPTAVWLKREGERNWQRHCATRRTMAQIRQLSVTITASTAAFGAAMGKAVKAASDLQRTMQQVNETMRGQR